MEAGGKKEKALLPEREPLPALVNAPLAQQDEVRRRCNLLLDSPVHQNRFAEEFHENHLGRHGVVTLSSSREDPLLWAHYGGSFAGFAVGYRAVDDGELEALPAVPVEYATDRPKISPFGATDWLRVLFTKSVHWSHEREWRYVRMAEDGGHGLLPVPLGSILEVCLGPRMVPADRDSVIRAARNLPDAPRVLQARLHPDRYGLIFADVD